jgi:PAS domain S-box-containing protein
MVLGQKPALPRDKQPLTRMAQSATAGKSGSDLDGYRDYRGVPVVGAWLWDGEYGFGITTEIDVEEAFATFNDMRIVILAFSGLAVGVLIVLAVVSGNSRRRIADAYRRNQLLLTSAGEGIYGLDNRGQTTFVNPAACEMLGYERDELIGQPMHALIHHSYLDGTPYPREKCHMYAAFTDGEVHRIDNEVLWRKDGASFPVEYTSTPILTGDKPTGAVVTFRDVSERRQAETELAESEERLRLALDGAEIGAWIRHLPAGPVIWDTRMRAIHGVTEENAPRSAEEILALIHPDDVDKVKQSASLARSGDGKYLSEHRVIRPDGEMRHVFANAVVLRDENDVPQRVVGITMDVTGQKQSEAELLAAKEAAEKASQAKSEFLSSMSHDLRTPMNSILGFAQVLRTDPEAPLSEDQDDSVEHIAKAGKHLLGLIDEVLDLTRIESGTVSLSPEALEPAMVVNECFDLLHSQAEDRKIFLKAELDADLPGIKADYSRLKDVLLNLLSNAVKYNFEQGTVVVRCQPVPGQRLRLSVADSGPGIPEESLPELFQPFNRLGAEASEIEGTGIGLTITKRLVELMDGEIGVESRQGKGCVFWIELPQAPQAPRGPQTATEADNSGNEVEAAALATGRASHKVLYVEDNPANTRLMRKLIARRPNCTLIEAASGEAGLDLAASERPDIIIMDINLPGIDGFETLRRLRLSEGGGEVPVMALSADAMPKTVDRGLEVGFFAYLTKPIEVAALLEALDAALGGKA